MGGCCAEFCNNSSKKNYLMRIFPKDPQRRAEWIKNVNRPGWTPNQYAYLCEVHFTSDMWEKRADNKPKLKPNAVPTIFGFFLKERSFPIENRQKSSLLTENVNCLTLSKNSSVMANVRKEDNLNKENSTIQLELEETSSFPSLSEKEKGDKNVEILIDKTEIHSLKTQLERKNSDLIVLRKKLKSVKYKNHILEDKLKNDKYRQVLCKIFNDDQIRVLITNRSPHQWSNETIQLALQLKLTCGVNGYEQLKKLNIPLPDLRTIRRSLQLHKI